MGIGGAPGFEVHRLVGLRVQAGNRGSVTARRIHEGCTRNARARPSWDHLDHRAKPCPRRSQMTRLYASAIALIVLLCACSDRATTATPASPSPSPSPIAYGPPQYRALWVDAFHDGLKSPAQVEKVVADAHRANLNALIVQVRKAGDAYFNRSDEPRASDITGPTTAAQAAIWIPACPRSRPTRTRYSWTWPRTTTSTACTWTSCGIQVWGGVTPRSRCRCTRSRLELRVCRGRATRGGRHGAEHGSPVSSATSMTTSSASIPTSS